MIRATLWTFGIALGAIFLGWVFGLNGIDGAKWMGPHTAWYASRAAGIASYLFIWIGLTGGLLMSSAWFDGLVNRARLLAIHQVGSIAGVLLGLGHALVLIPDGWTRFTVWQVLVPFASYRDTALTAMGTFTLYLAVIVSVSFWFRPLIGPRTWKTLHWASFVVYAGALWHGAALGTDTGQAWVQAMYYFTALLVVFAIVIRMSYERPSRRAAKPGEVRTA